MSTETVFYHYLFRFQDLFPFANCVIAAKKRFSLVPFTLFCFSHAHTSQEQNKVSSINKDDVLPQNVEVKTLSAQFRYLLNAVQHENEMVWTKI